MRLKKDRLIPAKRRSHEKVNTPSMLVRQSRRHMPCVRGYRSLVAPLVLALLGGCATFEGRELPRAERTAVGVPLVSDYVLDVSFHPLFFSILTDRGNARRFVTDRIALVFEASGLVARPEELDRDPDLPPVRLAVHVAFKRNDFLCYTSGWTSLYTLEIIPGYCRETFVLTIEELRGNSVARTYRYRDYSSDWLHLSLLAFADRSTIQHAPEAIGRAVLGTIRISAGPWAGPLRQPPFLSSMHEPDGEPVAARVLDNILWNFIRDFRASHAGE